MNVDITAQVLSTLHKARTQDGYFTQIYFNSDGLQKLLL